jgi:hypothetical protein
VVLALRLVLIEMDGEHLFSFKAVELTLFGVINAMTELRFDGCILVTRAIFANWRIHIPNRNSAVITSSD